MVPTNCRKSKGPIFLQEDALETLLEKHKQQALNLLIMNNTSLMDPTIGDASCEQRVGFILDTLQTTRTFFAEEGTAEEARNSVAEYDLAHKSDKADTQVKTVADAKGAEHRKTYGALIEALELRLGADAVTLLGLCYSFSVSGVVSYDEFGSPFSYRSKNFFATSTPKAEEMRNPKFLRNHEIRLRCALANKSVLYFKQMTALLPRNNTEPLIFGEHTTRRAYVEEQLIEANHFMHSIIPVDEGDHIPLMPIFNQFYAIGFQEFNANRPIIVSVRRIQLSARKSRATSSPLEIEDRISEKRSSFTYSHGDARALFFRPNRVTGRFQLATDPTREERETPYLFLNAWSTYLEGSYARGLDTANNDEYFGAFANLDIWWLVLQYAAIHPVYTAIARDQNPEYGPVYDQICRRQSRTFNLNRELCEGFDLRMHSPMDERPDLAHVWKMTSIAGSTRGLTDDCQEVRMGAHHGGCYLRIDRPVDFQIDHVHALSFQQAEARCAELTTVHATTEKAIIGPYVVRMSERGVSCVDREFADSLSGTKGEKVRKSSYGYIG